ncbi:MAG: RDD family protein [Gammaproteobacteria bacterium]|nr:RDD family protein [Gammaproteobacteria bacterium]
MFCSDCGAETGDQSSFCPACGHDLRTQGAQASVEAALVEVSGRAGFWRRFAAHAIDIVIVWIALEIVWGSFLGYAGYSAYLPINGIGAFFSHFFVTPIPSQSLISMMGWSDYSYYRHAGSDWFLYAGANIFVPLAAVLAYYVAGTTIWGRTLGKAALGIRVVGPDGTPPNLVRTIIRETIGKFLSSIFWIGFLMVAGKQKRGLHDRISGTEVVIEATTWRQSKNPTREDAR